MVAGFSEHPPQFSYYSRTLPKRDRLVKIFKYLFGTPPEGIY
jgi:hypothetical protein